MEPTNRTFAQSSISGVLCLLLSAAFMSTNGVFVKALSGCLPITQIISLRFTVTFVIIGLLMVGLGKRPVSSSWRLEVVMGFFAGATIFTYFLSIYYVGMSLAVVLLYTSPFFASLISWRFLGERLSKAHILCLLASFLGILLIVKPSATLDWHILVALLSGVFYGIKIVFNRFLGRSDSAWTITFYSLLVPALFSSVYLLTSSEVVVLQKDLLPYVLGLALIPTTAGFLLQHHGFRIVPVADGSVIMLSEAVFASVIGVLIFLEPVDVFSLLGGLLIIFSGSLLNIIKM